MQIPDHAQAEHALATIGYYRLSGYWYPYREPDPSDPYRRLDTFLPGTDFSEVIDLYDFDRALKTQVLHGIERVEVAFRSRIGYLIGKHGALAHTDPNALPLDLRPCEMVGHRAADQSSPADGTKPSTITTSTTAETSPSGC